MEKQPAAPAAKSKNKILKFLPRAASVVNFQNPPFSPSRDKRSSDHHPHYFNRFKPHCHHHHVGTKGFSGPIISMFPDEVRQKPKNETPEPTSPKVSCIGQIKLKKKMAKKAMNKAKNETNKPVQVQSPLEIKKHPSTIKRFFSSVKPADQSRRSDASIYDKPPLTDRAPSLSQIKRFASGRDTLANFDWTAQVTPVESDQRDYCSDEEEEEEEEKEVIIPFSAPIMMGGRMDLQPRKEVNLWKRRTMNPPAPLFK